MHSASASASLWLPVVMNLTDAQVCEVKRVDYAVAYARTVAGVHYPSDNIAGLKLGQELVARKLPQELHEKYGSDVEVVKAKIEQLRFNWEDFTSTDCFLNGLYYSE
jgi:tRNA U38,U39,U40 pseudouridine synthase TruA